MNIYVGNLSYQASEDELRRVFAQFGEVKSVTIVKDRMTGESRGFAFVEMPNNDEGSAAIAEVNGQQVAGRSLKVNEANPRPPREGGGGGRGGGGRGGYGGGGGRGGGYGGGGGGGRREPRGDY